MARAKQRNIDMLIRGIPGLLHQQMKAWANQKRLSTNQAVIQWLEKAGETFLEEDAEQKRRKKLFDRIDELREEMYRKYGKMEDSTKYIREDRDNR